MANNFQDWLIAKLGERDWSQSDLARAGGINRASISLILSENRGPGPNVASAIAHALRLPPELVFRKAGLLPPKPDDEMTFEEWKFILEQLPEEERDELLEIARLKLERQERKELKRKETLPTEGAT